MGVLPVADAPPLADTPDPPRAPAQQTQTTERPDDAAARAAELQRLRLLMLMGPAVVTRSAEDRYSPSAALARVVRYRDVCCPGPGCRRPAESCELDHEEEFSKGGLTAEWSLRPLSTRCHHARHGGWTADRDPDTGITTWTSPLGRTYTRLPFWDPPRYVPEGTQLSAPRLEQLPTAESDFPLDRPLWTEPVAPTTRPARLAPRPSGATWGDEGPPPF
jgi:hypothetical protein